MNTIKKRLGSAFAATVFLCMSTPAPAGVAETREVCVPCSAIDTGFQSGHGSVGRGFVPAIAVQHNSEALVDRGFTDEEIAQLKATGAI